MYPMNHGPVLSPKIPARDRPTSPRLNRPEKNASFRYAINCTNVPCFAKYRNVPRAAHFCTSARGFLSAFGA